MTNISLKPWSVSADGSIKDSLGKTIGSFQDYRDAENAVAAANTGGDIDTVREERDDLDARVEELLEDIEMLTSKHEAAFEAMNEAIGHLK